MIKRKPLSAERFTAILRSCAREMNKPYESRDPDFEEGAVVWALRESATRILKAEKTIERLKARSK